MRDEAPAGLERAVDQAARELHGAGMTAGEIVAALERSAVELGLAASARFVAADKVPGEGGEDSALLPVYRPDGTVGGTLRCEGVPDEVLWPLRLLASHAGAALDAYAQSLQARRREDALRAISEELQDALLPRLPHLEYTTMEVAYRAASAEARVGGDFYDTFMLPDGRVLIVVGDVVGKGVKAASHTSRITYTLRALALTGEPLDALLERCDKQLSFQDPNLMATVWCGFYEPSTGELAFASLGHPPALLLRAEGDPISLALEGLPLGMRDLSEEPPEIRTRLLQPRDLLVLYTDGVVEASGDYLAGQKSLLAAVESRRHEPLSDILDGVLDDMLTGAGHRDDAVLFLLRRR